MILDRVTFTGADDSVDPAELIALSAEFPFIEWGILVSTKHNGRSPRFPSWDWIYRLPKGEVNLSMHLCGQIVRDFCKGDMPDIYMDGFTRFQLNFHAEPHAVIPKYFIQALERFSRIHGARAIFQFDGVNDELLYIAARHDYKGQPLFDTSHGAGESPDYWPLSISGHYCGYAGGIGPTNVLVELGRIERVTEPMHRVWIDMERKVRSADDSQFDLKAVRSVCEQVKALVADTVTAGKGTR